MKLINSSTNREYNNSFYNYGKNENSKKQFSSPSFKGLEGVADDVAQAGSTAVKKHATQLFGAIKDEATGFLKRNVTTGVDVKYSNKEHVLATLRKNFGTTFDECLERIDAYNDVARGSGKRVLIDRIFKNQAHRGKSDAISYMIDANEDTITFHKTPFVQNICEGIKEFTVGTILDIGIAARNGLRKLRAKTGIGETIASKSKSGGFLNRVFEERIAQKRAKDAFYKLSGVFEQACEGLGEIGKTNTPSNAQKITTSSKKLIEENIKKLAQGSIDSASKKVGKYNTKSERAWNRLGTGFVSALFASTDFYNISMLQNNDPEKANASGRKRFKQDMRRQGLTAGITYVILGAFQNKVNKSMLYAVLSLGGVTLISEILSRVMGKIPLTPLSPEKAKELAEKKEAKANKKADKEITQTANNKADLQKTQNSKITPLSDGMMDFLVKSGSNISYKGTGTQNKNVFDVFQNTHKDTSNSPSFTSGEEEKTSVKNNKRKSAFGLISKIFLGAVGLSLGIGFLRTKNVFNIDTIMKSMSAKYNEFIKNHTRRQLILPAEQVDGFMEFLEKNGFGEQYQKLNTVMDKVKQSNGATGKLTGQARVIQKYIPKSEISTNGSYYDMGLVESKAKSTVAKVVLYPINAVGRLLSYGNNLIKRIFVKEPVKQASSELNYETAVTFIENYSEKFQSAKNKGDISVFREDLQDAFTRHFSEANSKNKNTTLAMLSRLLITFISGYFFVNDYRNEVLIESKGEDVERANATAKERVGHKISNFFFNSMFMDIFNTTFEPLYLSSVIGATAVAMATEVTNETAVRASICTPTKKMNKDDLIEYEDTRLNDKGLKGKYYRAFMKLTGKKPLSLKANKSKKS